MKTKNKRLFIIFSTFCLVLFLSLFSSQLFKLKKVEINFFDKNKLKVTDIGSNNVFNTPKKINDVLSSANFDYGNLVFLINKNNYAPILERKNPYLRLENIQIKFPNKLVINASERTPYFFIQSLENVYIIDKDFKLLEIFKQKEITDNPDITQNLIEIEVISNNSVIDFFSFFDVLPSVYEAGQNLSENNTILSSISCLPETLNNFNKNYNYVSTKIFNKISLQEISPNIINLKITTSSSSSFGTSLQVENIFANFNKKINKLLNALYSLKKSEPIKCSYGQLKIDNNYNCFWNNL